MNENMWLFRIKYITIYQTYLGLKKLKAHLENNKAEMDDLIGSISSILEQGEGLFTSKFRNCMMHYDLKENEVFVITEKNFDDGKIFFGLIEEYFDGETYKSFAEKIARFGNLLEDFMTQQFNFDAVSLKKL